jgi:hypothetical protein
MVDSMVVNNLNMHKLLLDLEHRNWCDAIFQGILKE